MKRRFRLSVVMVCIITALLPAANLLDLAARQIVVAEHALDAVGNGIFMASTEGSLLVAYQGNDSHIHLARSMESGRWRTSRIDVVSKGNLHALAAAGSLVVVGYESNGQIFTIASTDGGDTFSLPAAVIPTAQRASIQDMAIDDKGVVHIVFHRHDSYWDYNYARSTDGGKSYRTWLDFTKESDSNSTGYAGNLTTAHGNLYTVYQDNNDDFSVKLGVSGNGGESWRISRLASSSGGKLGLAVDPIDPDLAYVAAFNKAGLTILRIDDASTGSPRPQPVYGDSSISDQADKEVSVHIAVADDRSVAVVYLNPTTGSYSLLASDDLGKTWQRGIMTTLMNPTRFPWSADLISHGHEFYFARSDGMGKLLVHGPDFPSRSKSLPGNRVFTPDPSGLVDLSNTDSPFGIVLSAGMPMVFFSVPFDGAYVVRHLTQEAIPLYIALYDLADSADTVLAENYDGTNVHDQLDHRMSAEATYLLVLGVLDDANLGETARFEISRIDSVPVAAPAALIPVPVVERESSTDRVVAAHFNSFAIGKTGAVYGAGLNEHGQLGDGSTAHKSSFTLLNSDVKDMASGFGHTLFITRDLVLYATGRNVDAQLGDGTTTNRLVPFRLADRVVSAAAGYGHSLYVRSDGTAWAVGLNQSGQLGDGTTTNRSRPVKIYEGAAKVFSNYRNTSFILTEGGTLLGFGDNESGQLGLGHTNQVTSPTRIREDVALVAAGSGHTAILQKDGSVWTTGNNSNGQLGTANQTSSNRFVQVATDVIDIATGNFNTYLVMRDGTLKVAGSNQYGQYGIGNTTNASTTRGFIPVLDKVADVAAGRSHTVVLRSDNSVWTAGVNEQFQLGDTSQGFRTQWKEVFRLPNR